MRAVFARIETGYGRRFADHFKDMLREVHRYLWPTFDRLPYDAEGQRLGTRKLPFQDRVRGETVLAVLQALGVGKGELGGWLVEEASQIEEQRGP